MIRKILKRLDIDEHVAHSLLLRSWSIVSGAVLILLIPTTLSKSEQGFYFTFASILATQVFFELGLNTVITQMAGHEMAFLKMTREGPAGSATHADRLRSLFALTQKIYRVIAGLFFIFALVGGFLFFQSDFVTTPLHAVAWCFLVLFTSINLYFSPVLATLEGMGLVKQVAQLRLAQSICGNILLWVLLLANTGLTGVIAVPLAAAVGSFVWLSRSYGWALSATRPNKENAISWRREIFPFQWRIALSWLSGYFIFQLFNPFAFKHFGPEVAGQLGLSLTIFTTIGSLSISWINAKIPIMTQAIARHDKPGLRQVFMSALTRSSALNLCAGAGFIGLIMVCQHFGLKISERVLSPDILLILMASTLANHVIFSAAIFMRAHKVEPMLANSIVTAILTVIAIFFGSKAGLHSMMLSYLAVIVLVSLPWTLILWRQFYERSNPA